MKLNLLTKSAVKSTKSVDKVTTVSKAIRVRSRIRAGVYAGP